MPYTFPEPQSRNEAILQNILGAENVLKEPESPVETILMAILDKEECDVVPTSSTEEILLAIANDGTYDKGPVSENEEILLCILTHQMCYIEPTSRIGALLVIWANGDPDVDKFIFPFSIRLGYPIEFSILEE